MKLNIKIEESKQIFGVKFDKMIFVERTDIPKEYGLITYTQDKIITIT